MNKKIFLLMLSVFLGLTLIACKKDPEPEPDPTVEVTSIEISGSASGYVGDDVQLNAAVLPLNAGDRTVTWESLNEDLADVSTSGTVTLKAVGVVTIKATAGAFSDEHTITIEDPGPDGRPTEIVIMHGAPQEVDPRRGDFSGREKAARIALHEQVERELNVKIVYQAYPADAPWGPARQESIINWHIAGQKRADIYWLTTIWLSEIAQSNAIVPIDQWLSTHGKNIHDTALDLTYYSGQTWGFAPEPFRGERGIFINMALLREAGIEDPVDLWNDGEWTWPKFTEWAESAQRALSSDQYVLGGQPSLYAESLIPLNGGSIVDSMLEQVFFAAPPAMAVYDLLEDLHGRGLFEPGGSYDTGSDAWRNGNVLVHAGQLWFVRADNRWGEFEFVQNGDIGVVPFPLPDGKTVNDYKIPLGGEAVYTIANNPDDKAKEELAFEVWNRLQLWEDEETLINSFEDRLGAIFDDQRHVDVFLEIYDRVYFDIHEQLGIAAFGTDAWQVNVNSGVVAKTTRTRIQAILPIYESALSDYLGA
ncbi:MAG TPA: extracellular solute-binding protein [Acholeplasmataceae bacterium]|nr:extracellular solute-binding protein [Acholeplasmataceae bacterium]